MADLHAISSLLTSLRAAGEITKAMIGLRDGAKAQEVLIELRSAIIEAQQQALDAQAAQSALSDRVRELEDQIRKRVAKPCPKCGLEMKTTDVRPDPTFGDMGVQSHTLQCGCGHKEVRQVDPSRHR